MKIVTVVVSDEEWSELEDYLSQVEVKYHSQDIKAPHKAHSLMLKREYLSPEALQAMIDDCMLSCDDE